MCGNYFFFRLDLRLRISRFVLYSKLIPCIYLKDNHVLPCISAIFLVFKNRRS